MPIMFLPYAVLPWSDTPWRVAGAGTPSKHGGTQIGGHVEPQQQRHQAAAHPLLADVYSESVQAAIRWLLDASIMPEDSAFRDFVCTFCKLSFEMVSMQSGVDIGAGACTGWVPWMWRRIVFQVRARVLQASLLPARNGLARGGLVG
jgi:hypothetical protein